MELKDGDGYCFLDSLFFNIVPWIHNMELKENLNIPLAKPYAHRIHNMELKVPVKALKKNKKGELKLPNP